MSDLIFEPRLKIYSARIDRNTYSIVAEVETEAFVTFLACLDSRGPKFTVGMAQPNPARDGTKFRYPHMSWLDTDVQHGLLKMDRGWEALTAAGNMAKRAKLRESVRVGRGHKQS
ncbi:hypothetical protein POX_d05503 [Penicillium oxalicum]|uniref:hypothetical protein n=1 Tax=Penicillium oxalicum TaxID=69781 RepID=UPI0020B7B6AF|nr:hypothetical protein POX_d05503 [Penicillium oxalicum]KAI2790002.1 hypothetical protein POX_d05503 [Penicillium oxalicum]